MSEKKIDQSSLKSKGFLPQRQENMFSMRLKVVGGRMDAEKVSYSNSRENHLNKKTYNNYIAQLSSLMSLLIIFFKLS
jgi:hypothetical protein